MIPPSFTYSLCANNRYQDYFGPSDLSKIFDFCNILDTQQEISRKPVALTASADDQTMTKALFLVGAYMILCLDNDEPTSVFAAQFAEKIIPFKDILNDHIASHIRLPLQDCLTALSIAKDLKRVNFGQGGFDADEYKYFDNPLNADVHEIVPGKLLALVICETMQTGSTSSARTAASAVATSARTTMPPYSTISMPKWWCVATGPSTTNARSRTRALSWSIWSSTKPGRRQST